MTRCEPRTGATDTTRPLVSYRHVTAIQSLSSDGTVKPDQISVQGDYQPCGELDDS
jgi:hypothetical protein